MSVSFSFALTRLACLTQVPPLLCMTVSACGLLFQKPLSTMTLSESHKKRIGEQGPLWSLPSTSWALSPLTHSAAVPLASMLFPDPDRDPYPDRARQVPLHGLCTGLPLCLKHSSPRYLHGSPLTSLKPVSNATFSVRLPVTTLILCVTSRHATLLIRPPLPHSFCLPSRTYHLLPPCLIYSIIMLRLHCLSPSTSIWAPQTQGSLLYTLSTLERAWHAVGTE